MKPVPHLSLEDIPRIEAELLARLHAARDRYLRIKADADALHSIHEDLGQFHPDGAGAALKAEQTEFEAISTYAEAVHEFSEFILKRAIPKSLSLRPPEPK